MAPMTSRRPQGQTLYLLAALTLIGPGQIALADESLPIPVQEETRGDDDAPAAVAPARGPASQAEIDRLSAARQRLASVLANTGVELSIWLHAPASAALDEAHGRASEVLLVVRRDPAEAARLLDEASALGRRAIALLDETIGSLEVQANRARLASATLARQARRRGAPAALRRAMDTVAEAEELLAEGRLVESEAMFRQAGFLFQSAARELNVRLPEFGGISDLEDLPQRLRARRARAAERQARLERHGDLSGHTGAQIFYNSGSSALRNADRLFRTGQVERAGQLYDMAQRYFHVALVEVESP